MTDATPLASEQITDLLIAALPEWQRDVTRKALSNPARYGIPIIPADAALKALAALSASPAPSGQGVSGGVRERNPLSKVAWLTDGQPAPAPSCAPGEVERLISDVTAKADQCDRLAEVSRSPACFEYRAKAQAYREVSTLLAALSPQGLDAKEGRKDSDFAWRVPRHATEAMMSAGLYHCSPDMTWADLFTAWHYMVDEAQQDDGIAATSLRGVDGNDIWEALFGIMKGRVPDEMTEQVCDQLAASLCATPSQRLDAATVERCAQVADMFVSRQRDPATTEAGKVAARIRALATEGAGA